MTIPDDVKQPMLRKFHDFTVTPGWTFNGSGPNEKDRQLLVEYDVVVDEVNRLDPAWAKQFYRKKQTWHSPLTVIKPSSSILHKKWKPVWQIMPTRLLLPRVSSISKRSPTMSFIAITLLALLVRVCPVSFLHQERKPVGSEINLNYRIQWAFSYRKPTLFVIIEKTQMITDISGQEKYGASMASRIWKICTIPKRWRGHNGFRVEWLLMRWGTRRMALNTSDAWKIKASSIFALYQPPWPSRHLNSVSWIPKCSKET